MSFENIIGNENIKEILNKAVNTNNILHSYLFTGIDGIGKKIFAKEFAKMILCEGKDKPCSKCKSCLEFDNNNHPDFMIIDKEYDEEKKKEKNIISINQIREMNKKISEKPITSQRKVYIINDCDAMNIEAQNALLKTLEEPPEYAILILITSNESKLLNTIRSRCVKTSFNKIDDVKIKKYISENIDDSTLNKMNDNLLSYIGGSIGKLEDVKDSIDEYLQVEKLINQMSTANLIHIFNNADILYKNKDNKEFLESIFEYINIILVNSKKLNMVECVKYVEEAKRRININSNFDMTIDNLITKMWEEINEKYSRS